MTALVAQRCYHHSFREAVARCPECGHFYCRECVAEHDHRLICASCLKKLAAAESARPRTTRNLWPAAQLAAGFFVAWILFYYAGLRLVALPAEFHDDKVWQATFLNGFKEPVSDD